MKRSHGLIGAFIAAFLAMPLHSAAQAPTDRWTFSVQPYVWLPGLDAQLRYGPPPAGGSGANVSIDTDGVLDALNFFAMVQGEARKGRWSIFGDLIYVDFGKQDSQVRSVDFNPGPGPVNVTTSQLNSGTQSALDATVFTLAGGYNMVRDPTTTLDLIAGIRYANVKASTDWNLTAVVTGPAGAAAFARTGTVERSDDLFDGIIGARGRLGFGNSPWFVPYYIDVGAGSSDLTWQGAVGVGYGFRWGDIVFSYKYLYYDVGDDKFIQELKLGGFAIGANFRF